MKLKDCKFSLEFSPEDNEWAGTCDQFPVLLFTDESIRKAFEGIVSQTIQSIKEPPTKSQ